MQKYGFREGQGLGKHEQGLSTALSVEKTSKRGGKIIVGDSAEKSEITHTDTQTHMQAHTSHSFKINVLGFFCGHFLFSFLCLHVRQSFAWLGSFTFMCVSASGSSQNVVDPHASGASGLALFLFSISVFGCFVCFIMIMITYMNTLMFSLQEPRTHVTVADFSKRANKSHLINNDWWIIDNDE